MALPSTSPRTNGTSPSAAFPLSWRRNEWDSALAIEDTRRDYGETRLRVLALLHGRLHAVVVTTREDELRIISFRKASRQEERSYEQQETI